MLKRMFALSDQGAKDLNKGIAATTLSNLCLIAPVSLLVMVVWELLNVISGSASSIQDHIPLFIGMTVVLFIVVFLTQWLQYNKPIQWPMRKAPTGASFWQRNFGNCRCPSLGSGISLI